MYVNYVKQIQWKLKNYSKHGCRVETAHYMCAYDVHNYNAKQHRAELSRPFDLPPYPQYNHHSSDVVYRREGGGGRSRNPQEWDMGCLEATVWV